MVDESLIKINSYLVSEGYVRQPNEKHYVYDGTFSCNNIEIPVRIEFRNVYFDEMPIIRLREPRPAQLNGPLPHVDHNGKLCYLESETIFIDINNSQNVFPRIIETAKDVLTKSLLGKNKDDVIGEFALYWDRKSHGVYLSNDHANQILKYNILNFLTPSGKEIQIYLIGSDKEIQDQKQFRKGRLAYSNNFNAIIINMVNIPLLPRYPPWPPESFKDLFIWLSSIDPNSAKTLETKLSKKANLSSPLLIAINTAGGMIAAEVILDKTYSDTIKHPARFFKLIKSAKPDQGVKIKRISVSEFNSKFITTRNLPKKSNDLSNKNIVLVGCGTIGGYLLRLLVQSGAGRGKNGKITIFDPDILSASNIGRHYLDERYLFDNKAEACKNKLLEEFHWVNIRAHNIEYSWIATESVDLIIDATGRESFSLKLNKKSIDAFKCKSHTTPVLFAWIDGAGTCGRTFLFDGSGGCYRCLRDAEGNDRFPPTKGHDSNTIDIEYKCGETFYAFPPSVSLHVAAMGLDAVLDWANGQNSPRLRFSTFSDNARKYDNKSVLASSHGCPACQN